MKLHILKVKDSSDIWSDEMYYTIKGLRDQVLNEWYDVWGENKDEPQDYTKEQIESSDEHLFDYMNSWNFSVETILTLTENDIPKRSNVIEVDVAYYHPDDENGNVDEDRQIYDLEGMLEEYHQKVEKLLLKDFLN